MTLIDFRNASKEHAIGVFCVVLGVAMVAAGNLVKSLSFMADSGTIMAVLGGISSFAKSAIKGGQQTAEALDAKVDQRLAGQTNELITRLTNTGLDAVSSVRKLEGDRDAHAARLDAHDAKHASHDLLHASHATAICDHGDVLDNHGDHIKVISNGLQEVAQKAGVHYQPLGVLKTRAKPA